MNAAKDTTKWQLLKPLAQANDNESYSGRSEEKDHFRPFWLAVSYNLPSALADG